MLAEQLHLTDAEGLTELEAFLMVNYCGEKFQTYKDALKLFDELGITECQDICINLILGSVDTNRSELLNTLEDVFKQQLETILSLHGIEVNGTVESSLEDTLDIVDVLLDIPSFPDKEALLSTIEQAESDVTDTLLDCLLIINPELKESKFFEVIKEVTPELIDKIEEVLIEEDSGGSIAVESHITARVKRSKISSVEGPVKDFLLNGGSVGMDIKTLEVRLGEAIENLPTLEEKVDQCVVLAVISSCLDVDLYNSAEYVLNGAVNDYTELAKGTGLLARRLEELK